MRAVRPFAIGLLLLFVGLSLAACQPASSTSDKKPIRRATRTREDKVQPESIDPAKAVAVIETAKGKIVFKFFPDVAPKTVDNFIKLAGQGFYDGLTFHRVEPGFVVQGGDPNGNGTGGPGYTIQAEFNDKPHLRGTVAMARAADPDSAGSQFYITLAPQPSLDRNYTVFGQVTEGMDVVDRLEVGDVMRRVRIEQP